MLLRGAPIEPVGEVPTHALQLAISLNRTNIVSLLLAAGASLTAPREGTSPFQVVWRSSDAMVLLKVVVTRVRTYCRRNVTVSIYLFLYEIQSKPLSLSNP